VYVHPEERVDRGVETQFSGGLGGVPDDLRRRDRNRARDVEREVINLRDRVRGAEDGINREVDWIAAAGLVRRGVRESDKRASLACTAFSAALSPEVANVTTPEAVVVAACLMLANAAVTDATSVRLFAPSISPPPGIVSQSVALPSVFRNLPALPVCEGSESPPPPPPPPAPRAAITAHFAPSRPMFLRPGVSFVSSSAR
jgi:hypothetical protein